MRFRQCRVLPALLLVVLLVSQAGSADFGRVLQSCVFPGFGQLGDGQVIKGLSFMVVEAALLSLAVSEASKTNAFARETQYLQVNYQRADTYEDRVKQYNDWVDAYDKSDHSKMMFMAYLGGAGAVWALNIVDAFLFPPKGGRGASMIEKARDNTVLRLGPDGASLSYSLDF